MRGQAALRALESLVASGKVRYIGASNYASWQLMKALGTAERLGLPQFVSQQTGKYRRDHEAPAG